MLHRLQHLLRQSPHGHQFYRFGSAKTLHGKDIFEKVYLNDSNEIVEVEIDQSSLSDDDKKCFGNHIKELFKEIDNAIKKQFPSQDDGEKE